MDYPFGQLGSAVLAVPPPSSLCTQQSRGSWKVLDHTNPKHGPIPATVKKINSIPAETRTKVYKYLKGDCKENQARLFSVVPSDRPRGKGHKLKHRRICLIIRKYIFTVRMTEHWNRLAREVVESPSLEIFKSCWDKVLLQATRFHSTAARKEAPIEATRLLGSQLFHEHIQAYKGIVIGLQGKLEVQVQIQPDVRGQDFSS
ncbi:hypothetical protein QYF61_002560 [Mycteria americana]|uniref:Uncharacterized protein n=1 Tax=Mycteria americana TaxID=33587 RepID=A0AAN7NFJ9_MYCAM|nr:hypothetical protein QYF61_002560 [Mycteria americana]